MQLLPFLPARVRVALRTARQNLDAARQALTGATMPPFSVPHTSRELVALLESARAERAVRYTEMVAEASFSTEVSSEAASHTGVVSEADRPGGVTPGTTLPGGAAAGPTLPGGGISAATLPGGGISAAAFPDGVISEAALLGDAVRELEVLEVNPATTQAVTVVFRNPPERPITFLPGQHLTLALDIGGKPARRVYSICSDPGDPATLAITVKRVSGGLVSNWINDHLQPGDRVRVMGPDGTFCLDPALDTARHIVLIGAGVGITPLMSLIRGLLAGYPRTHVDLVYGNRRWKDVIFRDELDLLVAEHANLTVDHILTQPPRRWRGEQGRLEGPRLKVLVPVDKLAHYFICGPRGLMDNVRSSLLANGVQESAIREERFVMARGRTRTPDRGEIHAVRFARSNILLQVPDKRPLLEAGLEAGIPLKFSCAMGGCGTCRTRLLSGQVDMETPNCLTSEEEARGDCLLCIARPRSTLEVDA